MLRRLALFVLLAATAASALHAQPYASAEDPTPNRRGLMQAVGAALGGETKLTAGVPSDDFGFAVAVSGSRALVGTRGFGAYVFVYDGTAWVQEAQLTGSGNSAGFGQAVAIDGNRAAVGAQDAGAVYTYAFDGEAWVEQARLTPSVPSDPFGAAVSLSGSRLLVGGIDELGGLPCGSVLGSAYVFGFNGATWAQQGRLVAADGLPGDCFGSAVSLDGERALIGAYGDDAVRGSAYVFRFNGVLWSQQQKLTASNAEPGERFGVAVALSGDRALIGADEGIGGGDFGGAAYVFTYNGTSWTQQTELRAPDAGTWDERFGCAVALDGADALVGAQYSIHNGNTNDERGAAYRFAAVGTTWTFEEKLTASDGADNARYGYAVALDGGVPLVGAWGHDAAYVYGVPEEDLTYTLAVAPDTVALGETTTVTVTVTNASGAPLTNVRPTGPMQATSDDGGTVTLLTGPVPPTIPLLAPGASDSFRYTFEATAEGHVRFSVGVEATDPGGQAVVGVDLCPGCAELLIGTEFIVTAPADDEIVPPGEPYTVRFTAPPDVEAVDLYLVERALNPGNGERVLVEEDVPAAAGVYAWDVPEDLLSPSTFLIAVDADDPEREAVSERFRVRIPWYLYRVIGTLQRPEYEPLSFEHHVWSFDQDDENVWPEAYWDRLYHYYDNTEIGYDPFVEPVPDVRYDQSYFAGHTASDHPAWPAFVRAFGAEGTYATLEAWTFNGRLRHQPHPQAASEWHYMTFGQKAGYGGICYGLSMGLMAAFQDPERLDAKWLPTAGGSENLASVPLTDEVRDAGHALYVYQFGRLQQNERYLNEGVEPVVSPRDVVERLKDLFERDDRDRDRALLMCSDVDEDGDGDPDDDGCHAIVPYGMTREDDPRGLYSIGVYDPNFGNAEAKAVFVDSTANAWTYSHPYWLGDTGEGLTLSIPVIHAFDPASTLWPHVFEGNVAGPPLAARGGTPDVRRVRITGAAGAVTSSEGELRYEDGELTETLPDGFVSFPITGRASQPDAYVAPAGDDYRAEAVPDSSGTAVIRAEGGPVTAGLVQTGATGSTRTVVDLLDAGLAVRSGGAGVFELSAAVVSADSTEIRTISADGLAASNPAGLRLTAGAGAETFRLAGAQASGTYALQVRAAAAGDYRAFVHADVPLGAGAVHTVRPDWVDLATVTVEVDSDGDGDTDETLVLENEGTPVANEPDGPEGLPSSYALHAAYPNPFAGQTTLRYDLPEAGLVRLAVYDVLGREVAVLVDGEAEAGRHVAVLDGRPLPAGTYLVRLVVGERAFTQRVTLAR